MDKIEKPLGKKELIAIALGGMIGGGIFSILGVSASIISHATPFAILAGGLLAYLASYSYVKLSSFYKDEGATYSFFKKTFKTAFWSSYVGWLITFGYICTLALYAFTFSTYFSSLFPTLYSEWFYKMVSIIIIFIFATINTLSVNGMGKAEDLLVYTKVLILCLISYFYLKNGHFVSFQEFSHETHPLFSILTVGCLTFVAFEGFQLTIHAYNEAKNPDQDIPFSIYTSILITCLLYIIISVGALAVIPTEKLIMDKEFALASGAKSLLGTAGYFLVMAGALLATASAINGTLFGASRLMATIAQDQIFPMSSLLSKRKSHIPIYSIWSMALLALLFIFTGGLKVIIEFGSITFILVSFVMSLANFKIREKTQSNTFLTVLAMLTLAASVFLILIYEIHNDINQVMYIFGVYILLGLLSYVYRRK